MAWVARQDARKEMTKGKHGCVQLPESVLRHVWMVVAQPIGHGDAEIAVGDGILDALQLGQKRKSGQVCLHLLHGNDFPMVRKYGTTRPPVQAYPHLLLLLRASGRKDLPHHPFVPWKVQGDEQPTSLVITRLLVRGKESAVRSVNKSPKRLFRQMKRQSLSSQKFGKLRRGRGRWNGSVPLSGRNDLLRDLRLLVHPIIEPNEAPQKDEENENGWKR